MISPSRLIVVPVLFALFILPACSSTEEVQAERAPYIQLVPAAPPENLYEPTASPADPMHELWRAGYWSFDGYNFNWIPGEIIMRPHPSAVWSSDRWERRAYGWAFVPGYWQ